LFDQCGDVARVHGGGFSCEAASLAYGALPLRPARRDHRVQSGIGSNRRAERSPLRNTLVMIVLAILAAALWVATWQPPETSLPVEDAGASQALGYYVRGARILGTDEEGRVTYRIFAERLDELPDEGRLQLTGVDVEYQPADETAWSISAANASSTKEISQLELAGNVELRSAPTGTSKPLAIFTDKLTFWLDTSNVESHEPVEVHFGDLRLSGVGLRTDLKGDSLRLESDVHGKLVP
jgi:LPS export ABC transporter protein LptC